MSIFVHATICTQKDTIRKIIISTSGFCYHVLRRGGCSDMELQAIIGNEDVQIYEQ